ncbi:MAG: dynein regulation protein LC7 [Methanomicrobiales archaeon HGW-Methanomicrobiales-3]|jgi:predicted regulator of Ras-like GTPase activity (Roadblock/LC7/MglB family)|nr:MAG: dynein regulation protein LC7 [Methanomicrobiales archaeon HGW-Methanomicrobiales-3]
MKFPAGTDGGTISNPQDEGFIREMMSFCGAIEISTGTGHGFILTDNGRLISAYFKDGAGEFKGAEALSRMTLDPGDDDSSQTFSLHRYSPDEFSQAIRISENEQLLLARESPAPVAASPVATPPAKEEKTLPEGPHLLDESKLNKILSQPGVLAVSAFFEGFPVQSLGDADFEHVAASAEDFARAGTKIAQEMAIGNLDQLILETPTNKFIIAPCGDLYLCIFTKADAQLGLIRVVLKSIQKEIDG